MTDREILNLFISNINEDEQLNKLIGVQLVRKLLYREFDILSVMLEKIKYQATEEHRNHAYIKAVKDCMFQVNAVKKYWMPLLEPPEVEE